MTDDAPIEGLIFDMDGLLVDSEPVVGRALVAWLAGHGRELRPGSLTNALGRRLPEAIAALAEAHALEGPLDTLVAEFDELRYQALVGNVVPMPGAAALIAFARGAGLRLGLATSSTRRHADLSLGEAGLVGLFDAETTGDDVRHGKPAPDIFLLAAERIGVPPERCVVLEDAAAGLDAAAAAGMRRLWVLNPDSRQREPAVPPTATLPDLGAAIGWLTEHGVTTRSERRRERFAAGGAGKGES